MSTDRSIGTSIRSAARCEFYNLFNRHTYIINGCGGISTQAAANNFAEVIGVNDNPRAGQFGVRFTF